MGVKPAASAINAKRNPGSSVSIDQAVLAHPKFQELVQSRNSLAWGLTAAVLVIYFGFILLVAFDKPLLASKVGGTTSLGILLGLVVIVLSCVLTAIYVARANSRFDELNNELLRDLGR